MGDKSPIAVSRFPIVVRANLGRLGALGRGVVAVSGGADSVALLRSVADGFADLVVAHLNHQLRGVESDEDAAFVAQLCSRLSHRIEALDIAALKESSGDNLEAVARRARYDFLSRVAREVNAAWVATAHTLDDQAETVLHRLIRGTGLRGLRGIAAKRELAPGIALLRPMLTVSRAEVIGYLREIGQDWREDVTNRNVAFTRNRIRHELLPLLRTFNPGIEESLARVAEEADVVYCGIERAAIDQLAAVERPRAGRIVILDRAGLERATPTCLRELLFQLWLREGWPLGDMTREHWLRAADVVAGVASAWDLPGGIRLVGTPRLVRIGPGADFPS
jgi:tRNA(Ile)-lysidine synthase